MRILLAHKYHSLKGGAEVFYFEVARVLKEHGHSVAFFSTDSPDNARSEDPFFGVAGPSYLEAGFLRRIAGSRDMFFSARNKDSMLRAIDAFEPDLLHAFAIHVHLSPSILEAAKERGVPVVMSCNDYKHICPNYKLYDGRDVCEACKGHKFYNAVLKRCCKGSLVFSTASAIEAYVHEHLKIYDRLVDRYLFASTFMLEKTREFWPRKKVNYGVLKNPFDVSQYSPNFGGDYGLYFGRIIQEKGVDRIVSASEGGSVPLKIVGDGPDLEGLKLAARSRNASNIEFLGPVWGEPLKQILYRSRFVVVPSVWHENFPYVILQAFAAGKPVIGSVRGGIPELVSQERGLLFDPDDPAELRACIDRLWTSPELCERMGRLARGFVEREFADRAFYDALIANYGAVLT